MKKIYFLIVLAFTIMLVMQPEYRTVEASTAYQDELGNWFFDYESQLDDSYYTGLEGLSGQAFISKLNTISTLNHKEKFTYGTGSNHTRPQMIILDESPSDSTQVFLLYSGQNVVKTSSSSSVNQEHVWAKSHGFPEGSSHERGHAYADLHHLRLVKSNINSARNNSDFDYVDKNLAREHEGNYALNNTFEPRDGAKGDVARMLFYMDVRYAGLGGDPNLTLVDYQTYSSTDWGELGYLSTLLEWNDLDPVDDFERRRNDKLQTIQGNRNPFIDHPEYVSIVYDHDTIGNLTNEERKDLAISTIEEIGTVTLNSIDLIFKAENLYRSLPAEYRAAVHNYSILVAAREAYDILKEAEMGYYTDFSKHSKTGVYTHGITETINTKDWYFSSAYLSGGVRLGFNDCTDGNLLSGSPFYDESNPGTNRGSYFSMLWDYTDLTNITISYLGNYGTVTRIALYVSYDQGASYRIIASKSSDLEFSSISAVILKATARIAFVIEGDDSKTAAQTAPRLDISFVQLTSKEITIEDQIETVDTLTSMRFSYTNADGVYSIIDGSMGLRFGVIMLASLYDEITAIDPNAKFGMLVGLANMFEGYITETSEDATDLRLNVFRVNEKNEKDDDGEYYHFSLLIEDIDPESFETEILGRGYVEVAGKYYYFRQKEISIVTLAEKYLTMSNDVVAMHEGVLRFIAKIEEHTSTEHADFGSKRPGDSEIDYDSVAGG